MNRNLKYIYYIFSVHTSILVFMRKLSFLFAYSVGYFANFQIQTINLVYFSTASHWSTSHKLRVHLLEEGPLKAFKFVSLL